MTGRRWACSFGLWGCALALTASACEFRKPLPKSLDAAPPVQLVDPKPPAPSPLTAPILAQVPLSDEHEPNDDRDHAQPIEAGKGVRGSLAPPTALGAGKGDDDWYAYAVSGTGPQLIRVQLGGGPRADLSLEVESGSGQKLVQLDERGPGELERLAGLSVLPGQTLFLRVRGTLARATPAPGKAAPAAAEDPSYQLVVAQTAAPAGTEIEPNDSPALASRGDGNDLSGTLSWRRDEDYWVISLPEALGRKPRPAPDGALPGTAERLTLRVEVFTPGITPALRIQLEPAPKVAPGAPPPAAAPDGGEAPDAGSAGPRPPLKLVGLADISANKSEQELRLRNLGIPAGSARVFIGIRAQTFNKSLAESRYHLRVTVEPELEGSETEPNDDCAVATLLPLTATSGGAADGDLAGFLWPGDLDCFRLRPPESAGLLRWKVSLGLPGTSADCQATVDLVRAAGVQPVTDVSSPAPGTVSARGKGDVLVRVFSRERKTCFDAPYRLSAHAEPDKPGSPP